MWYVPFISTHSPDFLNALKVEEVYWLVKERGYTRIRRAREDERITAYMAEGDQMGYLLEAGLFRRGGPGVSHLVFLVEEPSARELLQGLLPRLLPIGITHRCIVFEGKQDLEKNLLRRIRGYRVPHSRFVVLRDQDSGDCRIIRRFPAPGGSDLTSMWTTAGPTASMYSFKESSG